MKKYLFLLAVVFASASALSVRATTPPFVKPPVITKTLAVGSTDVTTGGEVSKWQAFLVNQAVGSAASALAVTLQSSKSGYFGALTGAATQEWQKANGITQTFPATGPKTRAKLATLASQLPPTSSATPTITQVTPVSAPIGSMINVKGLNFSNQQNKISLRHVLVSGVTLLPPTLSIAPLSSSDGKTITFTLSQYVALDECSMDITKPLPQAVCQAFGSVAAGETYMLWVVTPGGKSNEIQLTVAATAPLLSDVSPSIAAPGETVTLKGANFSTETNTIVFKGITNNVTSVGSLQAFSADSKTISFIVPSSLGVEQSPDTWSPISLPALTPFTTGVTYSVWVINPAGKSNSMQFQLKPLPTPTPGY